MKIFWLESVAIKSLSLDWDAMATDKDKMQKKQKGGGGGGRKRRLMDLVNAEAFRQTSLGFPLEGRILIRSFHDWIRISTFFKNVYKFLTILLNIGKLRIQF